MVKTLVALLVAMTFGSLALMMLETAPIHPPVRNLAAVAPAAEGPHSAVYTTEVPIQPVKWRNIVIHSTAGEPDIAGRCHFVVYPPAGGTADLVESTAFWKHQLDGRHAGVAGRNYDADSIGICLVGDFSRRRPPQSQFRAIVVLVQMLQREFNISADHVYLYSELDQASRSPGAAFPARRFAASLLRAE